MNLFKSIGFKWGALIMMLFLLVLIPLAVVVDRIFLDVYTEQVNGKVTQNAVKVERYLLAQQKITTQTLQAIEQLVEGQVIVYDKNEVVLTPSMYDFSEGKVLNSQWHNNILKNDKQEGNRVDTSTGEKYHYVIRQMKANDDIGGVIVIASAFDMDQTIAKVRYWTSRAILIAAILAFAYTLLISWKLSRPLLQMEDATREIAKGNLDTRVKIMSEDEVGHLGRAINDLTVELNNFRANRSELLANISHELRTPVSYLQGYAQVIKNHQYDTEEELKQYATTIENEAVRFSKLIEELFDISKMEEGMIQLYIQAVDVEDLVEGIEMKISLKAQHAAIPFHVSIDENVPMMLTDGLRLEQILLNLLENAVTYMEYGELFLHVTSTKNFIQFTVQDTGIGIPKEDIPFIFDRFHRVEKSRVREKGGTGLGLSIVKGLVAALHGEITIQSNIGKGTAFVVTIPTEFKEQKKGI